MSGRDEELPVVVNPPELGRPRGYSNGMLAPAGGRLLCVAGQIGWDEEQRLVPGGFVSQFARSLGNVLAVVREAGGRPEGILRLTIYVVEVDEYQASQEALGVAYRELMGRHFPAMTLVPVATLLEPGAKVEIEATAVVG